MGVPLVQYMDDRILVVAHNDLPLKQRLYEAHKNTYIALELMTRLGYTLSLKKCVLDPVTELRYLGFLVNSSECSFKLPEDKRENFKLLREKILDQKFVDLKWLQKFAGKCVSMAVAVPGALFYIREVNSAISVACRNSKPVLLSGRLKDEITYWKFIDEWEGQAVWRTECHVGVELATDASQFRWAGVIMKDDGKKLEISDYFQELDDRPIHLKEAEALIKVLQAVGPNISNKRILVHTDSKALEGAWKAHGSRKSEFNDLMKVIFQLSVQFNLDISLQYINTKVNPADAPSRILSMQDARLAQHSWRKVEHAFGPHSSDLMSLDSNAMVDVEGKVLRHFTPYPTPNSDGVDVFSQPVEKELNPYVHPPPSP